MVRANHRAHGVTEIAQEMPAVDDMDRARCTLASAVGIHVGPVANNHFHPRVRAQLCGETGGVPIWQQVHHIATLEVNQIIQRGLG